MSRLPVGRTVIGFLVVLAFTAMMAPRAAAAAPDQKAVQIAHAMMNAMGGQNAWNQTHFVRFDFKVMKNGKTMTSRSHLWDKWGGRYRIEFTPSPGHQEVVLFNTNTKQGTAYLDGKPLSGAANEKAIKNAYGMFINDMYWLAMPWKWLDPGVHLQYMGKKPYKGKSFDVVELTFGHVGLTPGDRYDAYVSPDSHLMMHWQYRLQSGNTGAWDWEYGDDNGVKLAKTHRNSQGMEINMGDVQTMKTVNDAFFTDPAHMLATMR